MTTKNSSHQRLGVFGGTFDPPHVGHLILAMEALDQLTLDRILWVLAPEPPHKLGKRIAQTEIRLQMVKVCIGEDPSFEFSRVDIDRPGPHYVLDTVNLLHKRFPDDALIFIMGGDSLHDLPNWHEPLEFIHACDGLGVMHRVGEQIDMRSLEKLLPGITKKVEFIEAPILEISSNNIRQLVAQGKPYRYYLIPQVYEIIQTEGLYKVADDD